MAELVIDGEQQYVTDVTMEVLMPSSEELFAEQNIEFWPEGKWRSGYRGIGVVTSRMMSATIDEQVVSSAECIMETVEYVKPIWWRRLLYPVYKLVIK